MSKVLPELPHDSGGAAGGYSSVSDTGAVDLDAAMALATASPDGFPSVRMVLLKGHSADGFVFYTNAESRKGEQIRANMRAALLFHWKSLRRQIRIEGPLEEVSEAEDAVEGRRGQTEPVGRLTHLSRRRRWGRRARSCLVWARRTIHDSGAEKRSEVAAPEQTRPARRVGQ